MILADTRENNGANPYLESCIAENNKENAKSGGGDIQFRIKQITIGDYCVLLKDKYDTTKIITAMVIERKTWKDLAASIKDGRVNNQHKSLVEITNKKGCYVLYIIEGKPTFGDNQDIAGLPFKALSTKLRHNYLRGIGYIQTKDEQATAKAIVQYARDIMKMYKTGEIDFHKQSPMRLKKDIFDHYTNYVNEINSINEKYQDKLTKNIIVNVAEYSLEKLEKKVRSETNEKLKEELIQEEEDFQVYEIKDVANMCGDSIPKELTTARVKDNADIYLNMWATIPGISLKSAALLTEKYKISEIICIKPEDIAKYKKEISSITFPSGIKFGGPKADKVLEIINNRDMQVKILAEIPGLSEPVAKIILEKYSLKDICNGFIITENISELKNKNRKLGDNIANTILNLLRSNIN